MDIFIIMNFLGILIGIIFIGVVVLIIINHKSKNKWFCDKLGWHKNPDKDCNEVKCICPRCGKKIIEDGDGSWI